MFNRESFLKNQWLGYQPLKVPSFEIKKLISVHDPNTLPPTLILAGRVSQIGRNSLEISQEYESIEIHTSSPLLQILLLGDIISLTISPHNIRRLQHRNLIETETFELLVPNQGSPSSAQPCFQIHENWMRFNDLVRIFFNQLGFKEVQTPTLVPCPGMEPHLDPFKTELIMGQKKRVLYLPTSPEFHLKKMLSTGWMKIYEIKKCFRNGEIGQHHQPEFTMLEWYRAYSNLTAIEQDMHALFDYIRTNLSSENVKTYQKIEVKKIKDLFYEKLSFPLTTQTTYQELTELALKHNISVHAEDTWDDVYFKIFLEKIEPELGLHNPLIVTHYPPSQAALARLTEDGWADRFEVYWGGLELANAFHELNNPKEQRERFIADQEAKKLLNKEVLPIDEDFLQALKYGLPPAGGVALGLERLFMAFYGIKNIADIYPFQNRVE